jgi:BioD-like phosphotransacetylase family protein
MANLHILSTAASAGRTALAVGIAQGLAASGARVRMLRAGDDAAAREDAATFAQYLFAAAAPAPVAPAAISAAPAGQIQVIEMPAGEEPATGPAMIALRAGPSDADQALARKLGDRLIGSVAFAVVPARTESVARDMTNAGLRPLALLPEDRLLAAPSISELRDALAARVLFAAENEHETVEDVLVAPVYADPARPHFRRFASKAVLAPFNKTDLHIVAIETEAACLVITGGRDPSPYVVDRAQHGTTTVLLAPRETPQTIASLSEVWLTSRFRGERKAAAVAEHLRGRIDFAALARKIEAWA